MRSLYINLARLTARYTHSRREFQYLKTYTGYEVDFIAYDGSVLIETTISERIRKQDIKGLNYFSKDFPDARKIVVCLEKKRRNIESDGTFIEVYPYADFLDELWKKTIV